MLDSKVREQIIGQLNDSKARYQAALMEHRVPEYIVRVGKISLKFDIVNNEAQNPSRATADKASIFSVRDAKNVASKVSNGAGEVGHAVSRKQAIKDAIDDIDYLLALYEKDGQPVEVV